MTETQYRVARAPHYCNGCARPEVRIGDVVTLISEKPDSDGDVSVATHNGEPVRSTWHYLAFDCLDVVRPFKVGDRVRVAHPADSKEAGPVVYGEEVVATVQSVDENGDLSVYPVDGSARKRFSQTVSPEYLTLVPEEEPEADTEPEAGGERPTLDRADTFPMALDLALRAAEAGIDVEDLISDARKIQEALA
jgi:hypothetical protein